MQQEQPRQLPAKAAQTTAEQPWPVRHLSAKIAEYIHRMPPVWVEGQVVQFNARPGAGMAFLTLRDTDTDVSLPVSIVTRVLAALPAPVQEGARVVVHATPSFWAKRGQLTLQADDVRTVGVGELLARIEHLKRVLAAEGLFAAERKVPLPFLPRVVGLVCGRQSKAEHDVVVNATARWPLVEFVVREVAVQGVSCVPEVTAAIAELDADPRVDVIVVARGGGAVEDLLPFSNETMVRAAAACRTPLVSAIGHETDSPLLDLVADYRASTPTDAGKRIVPDMAAERAGLIQATGRIRAAVARRLREAELSIAALQDRPVLARPQTMITWRAEQVDAAVMAARRALAGGVAAAEAEVARLAAQVRALSPAATLDRGYAVVQLADGTVVRSPDQVSAGELLRLRLAEGELAATATPGPDPAAVN